MSEIMTFTKKMFDPLNPDPALIDIEDIAEWDIKLPTNGKHGALISWSSEDDSVLDGNGIVNLFWHAGIL